MLLVSLGWGGKICLEQTLPRPPAPVIRSEESGLLARSLKSYSLGQDRVLASLIWIQLLQRASHEPLTGPFLSWEYAQLEALTALDPRFEPAYCFGAAYLSVYRRDVRGAQRLLEKWVRQRPTYWKAHYTLGYHLYAEMGDSRAGATHLLKAAQLERAPGWISSLGVRLFSEEGSLTHALQLALELYESLADEEARVRLRLRIRSLNFHLQRIAWERALEQYRLKTGKEPKVLSDLSPLFAAERRLASTLTPVPSEEATRLVAETFSFRYDPRSRRILREGGEESAEAYQLGIFRKKP